MKTLFRKITWNSCDWTKKSNPLIHNLFFSYRGIEFTETFIAIILDDVIKWKHLPRYSPFCAGNSLVTNGFPSERQVTQSFDVFFDLRLNKRLWKLSRRRWFETSWRSLWRHCDVLQWHISCNSPISCFKNHIFLQPISHHFMFMNVVFIVYYDFYCWTISIIDIKWHNLYFCYIEILYIEGHMGPILQTWINFNPSMDK